MARKHLAALAALICVSTPAVAFDLKEPSPGVMFYFSVPLDARTPKERAPALTLSLQGKRQYEVLNLDTRMFTFSPLGGLEAKWIIAGVIAAGAAVAVASKDKKTQTSYQQQQQVQQQQQQQQQKQEEPCPVTPQC